MFKTTTDEYKICPRRTRCYKLVLKKDNHYEGPYTGFCYHPNVRYKLNNLGAHRSTLDYNKFIIVGGFFVFTDIHELSIYLDYNSKLLNYKNLYIADCSIPEGSKYFKGSYYDFYAPLAEGYVSDTIEINSILNCSKEFINTYKEFNFDRFIDKLI